MADVMIPEVPAELRRQLDEVPTVEAVAARLREVWPQLSADAARRHAEHVRASLTVEVHAAYGYDWAAQEASHG